MSVDKLTSTFNVYTVYIEHIYMHPFYDIILQGQAGELPLHYVEKIQEPVMIPAGSLDLTEIDRPAAY